MGHDALPSPTTEFVRTIPQITKHIPMSFKSCDLFDPTLDLVNALPDLTKKNLFDTNKRIDSVEKAVTYYEAIEPALRLASRIIYTLLPNLLRAIHHEILKL